MSQFGVNSGTWLWMVTTHYRMPTGVWKCPQCRRNPPRAGGRGKGGGEARRLKEEMAVCK